MKRHWPRVFSSFRSSKRRIQQLTLNEPECEVEVARGDSSLEEECEPMVIQMEETGVDEPCQTNLLEDECGSSDLCSFHNGNAHHQSRRCQNENGHNSTASSLFGSRRMRRAYASLREGK